MADENDELISLVYTSTASHPLRETAVAHLLTQCRALNAERGVTGMLLYRGGRFIQVLEGAPAVVTALVQRITGDSRHHDLKILLQETLRTRRFADWTMGYEAFRDTDGSIPAGYRDSFADLGSDTDRSTSTRALAELTLWFRIRNGVPAELAS
ncbi:BLUF domain-containing protein [Microbacterium sp. NPDC087665]|uniref:BLUF domain-containing protein n=1 Tax=Microbacterium sp. NPDC087665 TaxID=3364194 RepID=UPI00382E4140